MKTLSLVVAAIVLFFTQMPAMAQQVAQDQPKEAIRASTPEVPEVRTVNVSGTWEWQIIPTDARARIESTFDVQLVQNGEVVKGSFDCVNCTRIVNKAPVKGTLKNGELKLTREDMAYSGFELAATPDSMTGTYTGRGGVRYTVVGKRK